LSEHGVVIQRLWCLSVSEQGVHLKHLRHHACDPTCGPGDILWPM
jgi:hypothetical protein